MELCPFDDWQCSRPLAFPLIILKLYNGDMNVYSSGKTINGWTCEVFRAKSHSNSLNAATMRYSITFLGLIAFAAATTDPCQVGIQPLLVPLANDPGAAKFCETRSSSTHGTVKLGGRTKAGDA